MTQTLLGIDLGFGAIKIYGAAGARQTLSQVAFNGSGPQTRNVGLKANAALHIQHNGKGWYVGQGAHYSGSAIEALDYDRITSPEYQAILLGALARYFPADPRGALRVIVGVPYEIKNAQADRSAALKRMLKGGHEWTANGKTRGVEIEDVLIATQAAGAFFDFLYDDDGHVSKYAAELIEHNKEVLTINIGFNTVECSGIKGMVELPIYAGGKTIGARRLLSELNAGGLYSLSELDAMVRTGQIETTQALDVWWTQIKGFIEEKWGVKWKRAGTIIAVGGGALLLRQHLNAYFQGKAFIPTDTVNATAHGLYKQACIQWQAK